MNIYGTLSLVAAVSALAFVTWAGTQTAPKPVMQEPVVVAQAGPILETTGKDGQKLYSRTVDGWIYTSPHRGDVEDPVVTQKRTSSLGPVIDPAVVEELYKTHQAMRAAQGQLSEGKQ